MLTGAGGLVGVSARWWASLHAGGLVTCPMTVPWRGSDLLLYLFFIIFCFFKKKQKSGIWGKSQFYEYWQWSFKILKHCRPKQTRFMGLIEWTGCHFQPWYKPLVWEIKSWKSNIKREQVQKDRHFLGAVSRPGRGSPSPSGRWRPQGAEGHVDPDFPFRTGELFPQLLGRLSTDSFQPPAFFGNWSPSRKLPRPKTQPCLRAPSVPWALLSR